LTLRAARLLQQADVVLHDALVSDEVLALIRRGGTTVNVGKRCGNKLLTQQEISAMLVSCASTAEIVIRLKGGDPSIFARAGEEIEALVEAGIPFEIVPGITSASAAAAASGISLTDRRFASSVVFATAHRGNDSDAVEWEKLVSSNSTLAIYMPGSDYRGLTADLCRSGLDPNTPCVLVSRAGRYDQQVLCTNIALLAARDALPAPALLLVGRCTSGVGQAQSTRHCDFMEGRPQLNELFVEVLP
jgi:uroporphyrin-III C-methyltransferase